MSEAAPGTILARFRRGVIGGLALGVLLYVGYALWVGADEVLDALIGFQWAWLPILLLLSLANYAIRFARWEWLLRALEIRIPLGSSIAIFLAGLAMTLTPGKVGEFLKSYLLKRRHGVPMATSAPVVFAERVADLLSLVLLASFGVASLGAAAGAAPVLGVAAGTVLALLVTLRSKRLSAVLLRLVARLPRGERIAERGSEALNASRALLAPWPLLVGVGLGAVAWFCECMGYWLAFRGFGVEGMRAAVAVFAYAFSTVAGVVTPGGIGPTDIGLIELARPFTPGLRNEVATAASFLVRVCTLWFAVALGALALLRFRNLVDVDVEVARGGGTDA